MKSSLALVAPVVIVFLFQQNVQAFDSSSENTYPYRHISKYNTTESSCWFQECREYMANLTDFQTAALSEWDSLPATLRGVAEVVRQFDRLEKIFEYADDNNLTQCKQDFPEVLHLQKAVYNNIFNVCLVEATKQNKVDYKSNMNAIQKIIMNLHDDTFQRTSNCSLDSDCIEKVKSAAVDQLLYEEGRAKNRIMWYQKRMVFDNENSVRECVELKIFEQVGDIKKIVNTIKECISMLI